MNAGKCRQLVTIQKKGPITTGDRGQPVYEWVTLQKAYADIEPLPAGKILEQARQLVAKATHQITIRYVGELTELMRIVDYAGTVYQFGYLMNVDHRFFSQTLLVSVQASGQK